MKRFSIIFYCIFIVCCSSLPKKIEPQSFTFANMKMKYAREAQARQNYNRALQLYREAYNLFTRGDHIEGKINSSLSIARQYFYLDKPLESEKWLSTAGNLIRSNRPQMEGARTILLIEMAFEKNDYQKVIDISATTSTFNLEWQIEILCYTMIAKVELNLDYYEEFKRVELELPRVQRKFNKKKLDDPEVLGLVYYYTGYIHNIEKRWQSALEYFEKAREIDSQMDNTYGVGKDLYALGQCYEKLGLLTKAVNSFQRAAEIFNLMNDADTALKAKKRAELIRNSNDVVN